MQNMEDNFTYEYVEDRTLEGEQYDENKLEYNIISDEESTLFIGNFKCTYEDNIDQLEFISNNTILFIANDIQSIRNFVKSGEYLPILETYNGKYLPGFGKQFLKIKVKNGNENIPEFTYQLYKSVDMPQSLINSIFYCGKGNEIFTKNVNIVSSKKIYVTDKVLYNNKAPFDKMYLICDQIPNCQYPLTKISENVYEISSIFPFTYPIKVGVESPGYVTILTEWRNILMFTNLSILFKYSM